MGFDPSAASGSPSATFPPKLRQGRIGFDQFPNDQLPHFWGFANCIPEKNKRGISQVVDFPVARNQKKKTFSLPEHVAEGPHSARAVVVIFNLLVLKSHGCRQT